MEVDQINENIGRRIKDLRNKNGLTQQELADRTELTKGYISQLEHGQVTPSVVALLDLIECLGSDPAEFFAKDREEQIVYSEEEFFEKFDEAGSSIQWIIPTAQKNQMEPLLVEMKPHSSLPEHKPHDGEEFGYVLSGRITIHLGERTCIARAGEAFYYKADKVHFPENKASAPAKFIWVSTPPTF